MATSYKNIVITPNTSNTSDPKIVFSGANTTVNTDITMYTYPISGGSLSFEGSAGQLFSITNSLTGTIFSVNDVSGIPSIEVLDTGTIRLAQYSGNVGIGNSTPTNKLSVNGTSYFGANVAVSGTITSGTWNGSTIGATYGGTGVATYVAGDILYASNTTNLSALADVATGNALISGGVGVAPSYGKIGLTTHVSGTLAVGNGGTGQASALTQYGVVYGSTTSVMATTAAGTSTTVLHGNAAGAPTWGAVSLTADVSGILPVANGGTGVGTSTGTGSNVLSAAPAFTGNTTFNTNTLAIDATNGRVGVGTITPAVTLDVAGTINDSAGNVRSIINNAKTGAYVLTAADNGKMINITTGGVTVNLSVFTAGQNVTIYNNSGSSQTITQGTSVTMYLAGTATTGNRTLAQHGICTIVCVVDSTTFVASGAGLT